MAPTEQNKSSVSTSGRQSTPDSNPPQSPQSGQPLQFPQPQPLLQFNGQPQQTLMNPQVAQMGLQPQGMGMGMGTAMMNPNGCPQCGKGNLINEMPQHILVILVLVFITNFCVGLSICCCFDSLKRKRCPQCSYVEQKSFGWLYGLLACSVISGVGFTVLVIAAIVVEAARQASQIMYY